MRTQDPVCPTGKRVREVGQAGTQVKENLDDHKGPCLSRAKGGIDEVD